MGFAENLKKLRKNHGLTKREFAKRAGVAEHPVGRWESAQVIPSVSSILKICDTFHVTPNDLLGFDGINNLNDIQKQLDTIIEDLETLGDMIVYVQKKLNKLKGM